MTDPSTPVPSDEAIAAALRVAQVRRLPGNQAAVDQIVSAALTAAYAIDAPRLRAEAAAEARADVLQELDTIKRYGAKLTLLVKQRDDALARAAEARARCDEWDLAYANLELRVARAAAEARAERDAAILERDEMRRANVTPEDAGRPLGQSVEYWQDRALDYATAHDKARVEIAQLRRQLGDKAAEARAATLREVDDLLEVLAKRYAATERPVMAEGVVAARHEIAAAHFNPEANE